MCHSTHLKYCFWHTTPYHVTPYSHNTFNIWIVCVCVCTPSSVYLIKSSNRTEILIEHLIHTHTQWLLFSVLLYSIWWIEVTQSTILKFVSLSKGIEILDFTKKSSIFLSKCLPNLGQTVGNRNNKYTELIFCVISLRRHQMPISFCFLS